MNDIDKVVRACEYAIRQLIIKGSCSFTSVDEHGYRYVIDWKDVIDSLYSIRELQAQIPKWHYVVDNDFPTELEIVNVVWCNHKPPSYYQNIKDKRFVASAVYFKGKWYWYSSTCIDYLEEYGKNDFDLIDEDVEVIAWTELPKFEEVK